MCIVYVFYVLFLDTPSSALSSGLTPCPGGGRAWSTRPASTAWAWGDSATATASPATTVATTATRRATTVTEAAETVGRVGSQTGKC